MKSSNLDNFYCQLDKQILLAESYTEVGELSFIIKSCRLKPNQYVFESKSNKIILYRKWFDEFGNSLEIENKKIKLILNDLSLNRKEIICTDLYYGFSIEKVVKISKLAYFCFGKDDDMQQDFVLVTFWGIDNYFRTFLYLYGEWQKISPLVIGFDRLKLFSINRDIKYFRKFEIKENSPLPCLATEEWISFLPARSEFLSLLKVHCQPIFKILNEK